MSSEVTNTQPENPGALNSFLEAGGTPEEWHEQLDAFREHQVGTGLTDAELLHRSGIVDIEPISQGEQA